MALIVDGVFGLVGLVPTGPRPTRTDVFGSIGLDYKLALNVIATPDIAAPVPSVAVAVIVDVVDASAGIPPEFDTEIVLSVPVDPGGFELPPLKESPPHLQIAFHPHRTRPQD